MNRTKGAILLLAFAALAGGVERGLRTGFTLSALSASLPEYLLHMGAGLFWGAGFAVAFRMEGGWRTAGGIVALGSPLLFLALMHQTRGMLNDTPALLAVAAGLAAGLLIPQAAGRG